MEQSQFLPSQLIMPSELISPFLPVTPLIPTSAPVFQVPENAARTPEKRPSSSESANAVASQSQESVGAVKRTTSNESENESVKRPTSNESASSGEAKRESLEDGEVVTPIKNSADNVRIFWGLLEIFGWQI